MQAPLIEKPPIPEDEFSTKAVLKKIAAGTASFGIRGVVVAAHYAGNAAIMSSLGATEAAASSLATTIQGLLIGTSSGFLMATGMALADALGEIEPSNTTQGAIIKTGWMMALIFGAITTAACLSTQLTLPLVVDKEVAAAASTYLKYFSIAAFPDLLIWTNGQIIFKKEKGKDWIPLATNATYRLPALALSYAFAKGLGWGPMGVGLGSAISGWVNILAFQKWFSKEIYQDLDLYTPAIDNFSAHAKKFLSTGWKLSLQRITEWGNLAAITQILGAWSSKNLVAEQSSILMLNVCGLLAQGSAQASMLTAKTDCKEMAGQLQLYRDTGSEAALIRAGKLKGRNRKNFYISNLAGLSLTVLVGAGMYLAKNAILDWYIPADEPEAVFKQGSALLLINLLSLLPDANRVIAGGMLRGWNDLLFPTVVSLITMSVMGIPAGAGWGLAEDKDALPLFIMRAITVCLAAFVNSFKVVQHFRDDDRAHNTAVPRTFEQAIMPATDQEMQTGVEHHA